MTSRIVGATLAAAFAACDAHALPPLAAAPTPPPLLMAVDAVAPRFAAPEEYKGDFFDEERALKDAVERAAGKVARRKAGDALANFYVAHDLYIEALAALGENDDAETILFAARCHYALGRYRRVFESLSADEFRGDGEAQALLAVAAARLGAYRAAQAAFEASGEPVLAQRSAFQMLKAETALFLGDAQSAGAALRMAGPLTPGTDASGEAALLSARIALAEGERGGLVQVKKLAASAHGRVAARAALMLAAQEDLQAVQAAAVRWSGGAFEREALVAIADAASPSFPAAAFSALRRLADRFPHSDAAHDARAQLSEMLPELFARTDIAPEEAARLFYENVEFAPQGAAGDALIREVAGRLASLDLLDEAAELLEHQVFKRLRGEERSEIAADLADLYLEDAKPREALRVIRTTRIAGLAPETIERRRLIEATALDAINSPEGALALLEEAKGAEALRLRADIAWREEQWARAGDAYRALIAASAPPLNARLRDAAVRAATAFLMAGEEETFGAFLEEAKPKLKGAPEWDVLDALSRDRLLNGDFFNAYRAAYGSSAEG